MIKKSYIAGSLGEAVVAIRRELGVNAVILETKTKPARKTLFRQYPPQLEVIAGVEKKFLTQQQIEKLAEKTGGGKNVTELQPDKPSRKPLTSLATVASRVLERQGGGVVLGGGANGDEDALKMLSDKIKRLEEENFELKRRLVTAEMSLEAADAAPRGGSGKSPPPSARAGPARCVHAPSEEFIGLRDTLKGSGVPKNVLKGWEDRLATLSESGESGALVDESIAFFLGVFSPPVKTLPKVTAFVGPDGVGKTLSVMKLADHLRRQGKSVAVFSLDVNDFTGVSALRDFCDASGIAFALIHKNLLFKRFYALHRHCEHILIDTYGFSARDSTASRRLAKRLAEIGASPIMVLPAVPSITEIEESLASGIKPAGVILTRLDEMDQPGAVYGTLSALGTPVYYFGTGTRVAEDFEPASAERLVSLLFGIDGGEESFADGLADIEGQSVGGAIP